MINSIDRNPHKESRFSFQCTFASQGASYEKKPIYENNPTIPQSSSEKEKGVLGPLNSHGWKNEQGELFRPYDPAQPYGKIIGYDLVKTEGDYGGCVVDTQYNRVKTVLVEKVFFPILMNSHPYHSVLEEISYDLFPYMLVDIKELPTSWRGSNQDINKSHNILVSYMEKIPYHIFENFSQSYVFTPPKNDLQRLSFTLRFPDHNSFRLEGERSENLELANTQNITSFLSPNETQDLISVSKIEPDTEKEMLLLTLSNYVSPTLFKKGHRLQIKTYYPAPALEYGLSAHLKKFTAFIHDNSHVIVDHGTLNKWKLTNQIKISAPSYLDQTSGEFLLYPYYDKIRSHLQQYPQTLTNIESPLADTVWQFTIKQHLDKTQQQQHAEYEIMLGGNYLSSIQYYQWFIQWDTPFPSNGYIVKNNNNIVVTGATTKKISFPIDNARHTVYVGLTNNQGKLVYPAKSHSFKIEPRTPFVDLIEAGEVNFQEEVVIDITAGNNLSIQFKDISGNQNNNTSSGIDMNPYAVYGTDSPGKGYYYPLYLHEVDIGLMHAHTFIEIPDQTFYMPNSVNNHALTSKPDLPLYTAHLERLRFQINQPLSLENSGLSLPYQGSFSNTTDLPLVLYLGKYLKDTDIWVQQTYWIYNNPRLLPMSVNSKELLLPDENPYGAIVLNQQLQTHILLKIVTEEMDTSVIHQFKKNIVI